MSMASPSPRPRFLPISWRFLKERGHGVRAETSMRLSTRSPSPEKGLSRLDRTFVLHSVNTVEEHSRLKRLLSRASPCVLPHPNLKPYKLDAVEAAHKSFQRRLSNARNIYHRLHHSTDLPYLSNTAALRSLPITSLYKHHLTTMHKRIPTALRATCGS